MKNLGPRRNRPPMILMIYILMGGHFCSLKQKKMRLMKESLRK